ncbi:MAG TPA: Dabb family protein [Chthoniobacterales bacterium]
MIRHTVVFALRHAPNSAPEKAFLDAAMRLASIPSVKNFERLRQTSPKNDFRFGFSMEFDTQEDYDFYNKHPDHVGFVQTRWIPEVSTFLEIDYEKLDRG